MGKWAGWLAGKLGSPLFFGLLAGALYLLGWLNGLDFEQKRSTQNQLEAVQTQLARYHSALAKAEAASQQHIQSLQHAEKSHEQSTRLLRRSLAESQSLRADCRLNASLVQQLEAARAGAARAATGSTGAALPAAAGSGR